ncbi:hypothetical protein NMY22_g8572 [Coprinellus aureogranulatus]|nr:hypothetical protein NMY22_g8572 [Coprinellus aureogranulatus]
MNVARNVQNRDERSSRGHGTLLKYYSSRRSTIKAPVKLQLACTDLRTWQNTQGSSGLDDDAGVICGFLSYQYSAIVIPASSPTIPLPKAKEKAVRRGQLAIVTANFDFRSKPSDKSNRYRSITSTAAIEEASGPVEKNIREELDSALPEDPDGREGQVYNFDALDYVGNGLILASEDEETTLLESGDEEEWTVDSVVQNI